MWDSDDLSIIRPLNVNIFRQTIALVSETTCYVFVTLLTQ